MNRQRVANMNMTLEDFAYIELIYRRENGVVDRDTISAILMLERPDIYERFNEGDSK